MVIRHLCSYFNRLKWIPFYSENKISSCSLVFKLIQGTLPIYLNEDFTVNNQVHTRNTRYAKLSLFCPNYIREAEGGKSFLVRGWKLCNNLCLELRRKNSLPAFNKTLFNLIFNEELSLIIEICSLLLMFDYMYNFHRIFR